MKPDLVREDALARVARNPDDWHEQEILAWSNWRLGRTDEARAALGRALRLNPTQPELLANARAIARPGAKQSAFQIQLKIGVDLGDLLKD